MNSPRSRFFTLTKGWSLRQRLVAALMVTDGLLFAGILTLIAFIMRTSPEWVPGSAAPSAAQALVLLAAFALHGFVAYWIADTVLVRPVTQLSGLVESRVAAGDLLVPLEPGGDDEIGRLIAALNELGTAYADSLRHARRRADELATLNRVAETINRTQDLQAIFNVSLRGAIHAVECDSGAVYMWDERTNELDCVSYVGLSEETVRAVCSFRLGEGIIGRSAEHREIIYVRDLRAHPDFSGDFQPGTPLTHVSIPLVTTLGQLVGVIDVSSSAEKDISQDQLNLLLTVAHQVAGAIDKAQLYLKVSRHAAELERIVDFRTRQLAQVIDELLVAIEQAKAAEKLKSQLLSTVSHELRTPLATIKGSTSMLHEHYQRLTPELLAQHLKDIEEEADKLTELISNLLEMSRIDAGVLKIHPQPINLISVLESTVSAAQRRITSHSISLVAPAELPACFGDARRIEQIVANMLDNAAKYSPPGKPITVRVEGRSQDLAVSVSDHGQGISPEHLGHIFDRFYQIDKRDSGRHGIGLGLAICRGLVEAHGGGIWVESRLGEGSTFSFSLPYAPAEALSEERWHEKDQYPHR